MAEPAQRRTGDDGSKFYEHPSRTEDVADHGGATLVRPARYVSVTSVLDVLDKDALKIWSANLSAKRAADNLPLLMAAALVPDCGRSRARSEPLPCEKCLPCVTEWVAKFHFGESARRAREGSAAHDVLERWILAGEWIYTPQLSGDPDVDKFVPTQDDMKPYIAALKAWVADFGLRPDDFLVSECTVWNHRLQYAGTLDFIVTIHPRTVEAARFCARINAMTGQPLDAPVRILGDAKSREGEGAELYDEHPLQLVAYRFAETMTPKGGAPEMERPMLEVDAAAILQVRPDGYTFRPVRTTGKEMRAFEAAMVLSAWKAADAGEAVLVRAFPTPDGWKKPTWERATFPDGAGLCTCAGCDDPSDGRCLFGGQRPMGPHTREIGMDGQPVERPKKTARKAAAPRKTAAKATKAAGPVSVPAETNVMRAPRSSPTLDSMRRSWPDTPGLVEDDGIPF